MKRYRNREIWDFEHDLVVATRGNNGLNGGDYVFLNGDVHGLKVIQGIDGGTTSTVCVCMSFLPFTQPLPDPLPILARAVAGCSNHNSVGETAARDTLEHVMAEALSKSASTRSAVQAVCLSVSGVNHPTDQHRILTWLREIFPIHVRLFVQNDAVAALACGTMGKLHGCVLIAAAQALTAVIRAHDGRGPETTLIDCILHELKLSSPDELIGWTYADPSWARIAAPVPVVVSCADAGDPVANIILHGAVKELASSVKAVVENLEIKWIIFLL